MIEVVLWDFGGVITSSPFEAFNRYEDERGLPKDIIRRINATNPDSNAWAQLESSEISPEEFDAVFAAEAKLLGFDIPGLEVLQLLSGDIRPEMAEALRNIKQKYRVACITNNVKGAGEGPGMATDIEKAAAVSDVLGLFDVVIESSLVGFRKPDPRIYQLACEKMNVSPENAVFIDDLGINLKPARALGMTTIKVLNARQALHELSSVLEMDLLTS